MQNSGTHTASPAESEQTKSTWSAYQTNLSDLFRKPNLGSSTVTTASTVVSISPLALASSPYLEKMTNSGQRAQSRDSCSNLTLCDPAHELPAHFGSNRSPLVNTSESESPVDLHLYPFGSNSPVPHLNKLCEHRNFFTKCEICNPPYSLLRSINKLNPNSEVHYNSSSSGHMEIPNKVNMSSLNSEVILTSDNKSPLFATTSSGMSVASLGGNPLASHLGHISTSIAAGISGAGINAGLAMAGGHLHSSPHHVNSHQAATLHSMSSTGFNLHTHLATMATTSQRRMSNSGGVPVRAKSALNPKSFLCPACNKLFTQKGNLKTHMMIHTGDKPYSCNVCGKSFTQKGNVDTHIKIHTGVKDYSCPSCGKSFTQKGNLKTHVRSVHTKEKPYACSVCGKGFSQKGNMHTHIRTHNKDDRFPCNLCGKTFSQKGNLKTHQQRHAGTLPKRYGPGGQRRQTSSRLLQVPVPLEGAYAAVARAIVGNVTNERGGHPSNQQSQQANSQLNRTTPVSPQGGDNSRSPPSLVHGGPSGTHNEQMVQRSLSQQSIISPNVQNQQEMSSLAQYRASSNTHQFGHVNSSSHSQLQTSESNSFNLASTPTAAAAAAAVLLSSTSSFAKDPKTNHLHFMSSLFH